MSELSIEGLRKSFGGTVALDGVDLHVTEGDLVAVLGPSGCGKTTLLRCTAGFERADAGSISVAGKRIDHLPPQSRRIGVVPQEGALFPHLTVGRNVAYGLRGAARRSGRVAEVLKLVGLGGFESRMPHELSGGQRQRVALARAMAPRPELILLDEPFSALDAGLRQVVRAEVAAALRADGATAVLVTHDQDEALSLAGKVAVMREGRIIQFAEPQEVYRSPADPWTASFVGDAVWIDAEVHDGSAATSLGELAADAPDGPVRLLLRPEQLCLGEGDPNATVAEVEYFGHDALVSLEFKDGRRLRARVLGSAPFSGQAVSVTVNGKARAF
ncbi:ABC transporter ATP-binding protein [Glycomyces buryatensis]|uniref:ABC-type quaternary amine transporter n=1 Tax=Glycomyces buryatensis TaxID=2570927 RepID=A0A4S8Q5N7_9ACTN|nr:ABC transporter ATP-binding protein [Glycomyces buryatensis]THV38551.1 ABC transporter ATP-binding protein [Glycomyces buryatensis]